MEGFTQLGDAERHVAEEFTSLVKECSQSARELLRGLEEIDLDRIDSAMMDSEVKKTVISSIKLLNSMKQNLNLYQLMPLVMFAIMKER